LTAPQLKYPPSKSRHLLLLHISRLRVKTMAEPQIILEQYQSSSLHEAGHALIASVLGRQLKELSVLEDQYGSGYVCRQIVDAPGQSALEEIAILLAGEAAPYLWGGWVTPWEDDWNRIENIVKQYFPFYNAHELSDLVRPCVQSALSQLKAVLAVLAHELSARKKLSGSDAAAIIRRESLPDVALVLLR
jgi:hypothetical protein